MQLRSKTRQNVALFRLVEEGRARCLSQAQTRNQLLVYFDGGRFADCRVIRGSVKRTAAK